ncbi:hypothetical protein [Blastomonas fulva]|uniref:hypothetical protein n=1 Tax=Blastomonas fulva TaxID=1550728 RepID=UPI0013C2E6B7|nr:hypothetical protein [Blastomonas fulva]
MSLAVYKSVWVMTTAMILCFHSIPAAQTQTPTDDGHAARCTDSEAVPAAACFSGFYVGQPGDDTAPVLHLLEDGSFEWWQRDQSVPSFSIGVWAIEDDQIVLQTDVPPAGVPAFSLDRQAEWSSFDEQRRINRDYDGLIAAAEARCPFAPVVLPVQTFAPPERPRPGPLATSEAQQTFRRWQLAKQEAELAAQRAVDASEEMAATLNEQAREALYRAEQLEHEVTLSYQIAGLAHPRTSPPVLPETCRIERRPDADNIPQSEWRKGIEVQVSHDIFKSGVGDVIIRLEFADGQVRIGKTDELGAFYDPGIPGNAIVRITADHALLSGRLSILETEPFEFGVVHILADSRLLGGARFISLKLTRDGAELVSDEETPVRYVRE